MKEPRQTAGLKYLLVALAASGVMAARITLQWDSLPETMATHFDASGTPDGFSAKGSFLTSFLGIQVFLQALLLGSALLIHKIPVAVLNIPEKERWIQSGQMNRARAITRNGLLQMGASSSLLVLALFELMLKANRESGALDARALWIVLLVYSVHTLWLCFAMMKRLKHPPR